MKKMRFCGIRITVSLKVIVKIVHWLEGISDHYVITIGYSVSPISIIHEDAVSPIPLKHKI